jgi:cytoskeletal protein RodZ
MAELLETKPKVNVRFLAIVAAAAVVVLGAGGYLIYKAVSPRGGPAAGTQQALLKKEGDQFVFQEEVRTRWFAQGSSIVVPIGQKSYTATVASIGDTVTLRVPGGTAELTLGKERFIDLDGDSQPDLKVVWNDTDRTSPVTRANLGLYRVTGAVGAEGAVSAEAPPAGQTAVAAPRAAAVPPVRQADVQPATVTRSAAPAPITVDLTFRDYCLFRYLTDAKDREERFFQKGESFSLDAKNQMTLWISNAGAVKAKVSGKDVDMGKLGEVSVRRIAWRKDASQGDYVLEVTPQF